MAFSGGVTFGNQKMEGQVVDVNGIFFFTQRSIIAELAKSVWQEPRQKWSNFVTSLKFNWMMEMRNYYLIQTDSRNAYYSIC